MSIAYDTNGPELGAKPIPGVGVRFCTWAPSADSLQIRLHGEAGATHEMTRLDAGYFELTVPGLEAGADYSVVIHGNERPDPASRHQPEGVHGKSRIVNPEEFVWTDTDWTGVPLSELVIYELHVGTFTLEGTFDSAIERFSYLAHLGITAIELMPVAEFPGARNWGYDGVHLYAPQSSYGGPEGLRRFVDAAHAHGIAILLDVVYNHVGPEGNYLREFGPYFTDRHHTPWGESINYDAADSGPVRRHVIENALYWQTEFHIDGLRLDSIHGIVDLGARHLLAELVVATRAESSRTGRPFTVTAESDLNDSRLLDEVTRGGYDLDAQWSDDFHHAFRTVLTSDRDGYFADFAGLGDLRKAYEEGFVYDGQYSGFRRRRHGNTSKHLPGEKFIVASQNHDQIANASAGRRLAAFVDPAMYDVSTLLLLGAPNLPLLFMGQEFAAATPFEYFISHTDTHLVESIRAGRVAEADLFGGREDLPDPLAEETFAASKLDWGWLDTAPVGSGDAEGESAAVRSHRVYREMLALRKRTPALRNCRKDLTHLHFPEDGGWIRVERSDPAGGEARILANLSDQTRRVPVNGSDRVWIRAIWTSSDRLDVESPRELRAGDEEIELPSHAAALYLSE